MSTDNQTRKAYRAIGHKLHPIVTVKELSKGVCSELARALDDHELIKIKVLAADRDEKKALIDSVCAELGAELIQTAGHVALIYRAAQRPNPALSNLQRHKLLV
jgi:RNA-binding protein